MSTSIVQNTLAAGEVSPHLYGRTDLAKYHAGMMLMRNVYVDYRGGGSSRQGTQFIGISKDNVLPRIKKFVFSGSQTYLLVFTNLALQIIKNPLTPSHLNGSNTGFIETAPGVRYTVVTPYVTADLGGLKFTQSADLMTITHPSYPIKELIRISDTNWTLTDKAIGTTAIIPTGLTAAITALPAGSTDPQNTNHSYVVTAIDQSGQESQPSAPAAVTGINIAATQGTITLRWNSVNDAQFYYVYRAVPSPGAVLVPPGAPYGFIGVSYGTEFTDSNIIADFSQSPPQNDNPFALGRVIGFRITNPGATYPVGATTASITDANGATASIIPVLNNNTAGGTGSVTGFVIKNAGHDIANGASIVVTGAGGAGFVGTVTTAPASGANPGVSTYFQQRQVFAGSAAAPLRVNGSRPAFYNNFDVTNPIIDSDAYEFNINAQEVNTILHMLSMPGGLVLFTDGGVIQLTGGSSNPTNPAAVTPSSAVIVPQSYYGAADVEPIIINYDILFLRSEGSAVIDLSYNFYVNIYTGADLTILSNHLFYPNSITRWAYQDSPSKIIWAVRSDGLILTLTYLKEQDIYGWAQHNTQGTPLDVESVREDNTDAVYFVVLRNGNYCIERLADRRLFNIGDAWCLDSALFAPRVFPAASLTPGAGANVSGTTNVTFAASAAVFAGSAADIGKAIRGYGNYGAAIVTGFVDTTHVTATVVQAFSVDLATNLPIVLPANSWTFQPQVSSLSGLTHLNGLSVMALVDGIKQGPFTVVAGAINLTTPGFDVLVGLKYVGQLQQLPPEAQGSTTQGKRDRSVSVMVRVMDAGDGLQIGPAFNDLHPYRPGISSTDPAWSYPYGGQGLITGDQRINLPSGWDTQGGVCIQMDDPLPFTILSLTNEIVDAGR